MRRNLLWLGILVVMATISMGLLGPRPKSPWEHKGIGLGHGFLPDEGGGRGYCGSMVSAATGNNCEFAAFEDRDPGLHVRFYNERAVLVCAPQLTQGVTRLTLGMKQDEVFSLIGQPTQQFEEYRRVLVYDEGASILAVVLESDSVVLLQTLSKFQCSTPRGDCAYYWGWWEDYLTTQAMEVAAYDRAWPWCRRNRTGPNI